MENGTKQCQCRYCTFWSPLIKKLESKLDAEGKQLLEILVHDWLNQSDEIGSLNGKLDGNWPGWEDMKGYDPLTHKIVPRTPEEIIDRANAGNN